VAVALAAEICDETKRRVASARESITLSIELAASLSAKPPPEDATSTIEETCALILSAMSTVDS
jgi:hypothetical protein